MDRSRLEAFSDGVFAVAITLLALNLTVAGPSHVHLLHQLSSRWPAFVAYLISFFMIGIVWVNHHVLVRGIAVVDRTLLFLNLVLLLFVVMIPFATATVADYLAANASIDPSVHRDRRSRWRCTRRLPRHVGRLRRDFRMDAARRAHVPAVPADKHWAARARFVGGGVVYVIAIVVALFNAIASFVIIALVAVYYIFERTPGSRGSAEAEPPETQPPDAGESF